ncbi:MAG: EFR1 family ferrodoxin, partial [Coriobacteriales bacterium]|jgi:ferredoxin|nr:EFR1 family ferrodoxin [Coriobacteriales bacterium]
LNYATGVKTMGSVGLIDPGSQMVERRLASMAQQVDEIAEAVGNRQENCFQRSSKLLGNLVRAYTDLRRRSLVFRIDQRCTKCGICAQVCPAQNISMGGDGRLAPTRSDRCEACYACIHWCPANAIATKTKLHSHYHHPGIKPEQINPALTSQLEGGRDG